MNGRIRPLLTDEPVEYEKLPVEIQNFREIYPIILEESVEYTSDSLTKTGRSQHETNLT
jgi:hypothetical protein